MDKPTIATPPSLELSLPPVINKYRMSKTSNILCTNRLIKTNGLAKNVQVTRQNPSKKIFNITCGDSSPGYGTLQQQPSNIINKSRSRYFPSFKQYPTILTTNHLSTTSSSLEYDQTSEYSDSDESTEEHFGDDHDQDQEQDSNMILFLTGSFHRFRRPVRGVVQTTTRRSFDHHRGTQRRKSNTAASRIVLD